MAEITLLKKVYSVYAGRKVGIAALLTNWIGAKGNKRPPRLFFVVSEGEGEISEKGLYTAPVTREDVTEKVTVLAEDPSISPVEVLINVQKIEPIFPKHAKVLSGGEVQFKIEQGFRIKPRWEIEDFSRDKGSIDSDTGLYTAPEIIKTAQTIKVCAIDLSEGEKDIVDLILLSIELKTEVQPKVHAGDDKLQLKIESHNDLSGLENFSCKVKSGPGSVEDGGWYTPPLSVDKTETVEVEATSKLDKTKKVKLSFEVGFPLCKKCKTEVGSDFKCPVCGEFASYGAFLKERS